MENNVNLMRKLTHINNDGEAEMVDVSGKPQSRRTATAISTVTLKPDTMKVFNRYWQRKVPGIKPTAGYPLDARRFRKEIRKAQKELDISDHVLWRER